MIKLMVKIMWFLMALGEFMMFYFTLVAVSLGLVSNWLIIMIIYFALSCIHSIIRLSTIWDLN